MIKVTTLASLCVLMISQVHAGLNIGRYDCLFERQPLPAGPLALGAKPTITDGDVANPVVRAHLRANANNVTCVQRMEKDFLNRLNGVSVDRILSDLHFANTTQHIKEDVLKNLSVVACTAFEGHGAIRQMTVKQIATLPNQCIGLGNIDAMSPAQVKAIVPKTTGRPASDFLIFWNFRKHVTEKQLAVAAGNDYTQCSRLSTAGLVQVNSDTLAKLDYRCLKAIPFAGITEDEAKVLAKKLNPEALSELVAGQNEVNLLKYLGPRFLKVIDKKNKEDQCRIVNLNQLKPIYSGDINKTCFAQAISNMSNANLSAISHGFYLLAQGELFGDVKEVDLIKNIADTPRLWSSLQKKHYEDILKLGTEACESIKFADDDRKFPYAQDLGAECFARMPEATQRWVLKHHGMIVKEDILSKVDGSHRNSGSAYLEDLIKEFATARPQLLKHFGVSEASNSENVCSTYDVLKLKDPKELKRAGRYFPANCLKSMLLVAADDAIQFTDLSLYPKALVDILDMAVVIENLSDDSLHGMDEQKWKAFIGPTTCAALTHEKFGHVSHDVAYPHITAPCLDALTFLGDLDADDVKKIPAKVLGAAKSETIGKLTFVHFSIDQIKALGTNASGLGNDVFNKLDNEQIAALNATAISSLPTGAFSALKVEGNKWQHVTPEALTAIKYDQLNAVPEEVLLQTTEKQAAKIPADAAKAFTAERRAKLSTEVSNALPPLPSEKKSEAAAK